MCDVTAAAIRPRNLNGVRFKTGRHHMNNGTGTTIAARLLCIMVHAKTVI